MTTPPASADAPAAALPWLATSAPLHRLPFAAALLGAPVQRAGAGPARGVLAWGRKPSARKAEALARRRGLPLLRLEDGFLRSFGTGDSGPALSLVADEVGIYYDSTRPSALEALLASDTDVLAGRQALAEQALGLMRQHRLSKYNHAPPLAAGTLRPGDRQRVLVVDQTWGDLSVHLGGADAATFDAMLAAARAENPQATVYVKTHPETSRGRKRGYLTAVQDSVSASGQATVVLREPVNPMDLVDQMDRVYVVSSTLGFEALLAGKPVSCFGLPWYAGWGATDDRQTCLRRGRPRTVLELFAAAYLHYARYLNPHTRQAGSILDVIDWLCHQRRMAGLAPHEGADPGQGAAPPAVRRLIPVGFARWRRHNLGPLLASRAQRLHPVADSGAAAALAPGPGDALVCWGRDAPPGLEALAARSGAALWRLEDGFIRSVGLGSDLIRPWSLVMDGRGLYFDPAQPSDLEHLLAHAEFSEEELARARAVRHFIVTHGLSKYNLESDRPPPWASGGRRVVLVPGQVEDDASVRYGGGAVQTNLALLRAARAACPDAFLVYKPHPDVLARNRRGRVGLQQALAVADHVETAHAMLGCLAACDELHTLTSLAGFEALLRGKRVVTYGHPFYAGWGLTEDRQPHPALQARRQRRLTLDELVAGALLRYPLWWDWELRGHTRCETVLHRLLEQRERLQAEGGLQALEKGWWRRQLRKLKVVGQAWRG
ncbi:capsular polysaccharide biosynthesis protein [Hydrogenophaga sp.]|uniref:capsular polysaccharide biosynthesis protein n=1 Tax=Hydrogenophaga sp. TaxID=1904254 RepID=UPI002B90C272|nr:capsular polysaccharide biosynthesis protein [Hydrogenophaga sp.]HMP12098.1 capsular polysaccharide biosynthesis protein [Hydrogenophaga sp.]